MAILQLPKGKKKKITLMRFKYLLDLVKGKLDDNTDKISYVLL